MASPLRRALRYGAAWLCVALALAVRPSGAQSGTPTVTVSLFGPDTLRSLTPPFVINASGFGSARPLTVRLQIGTSLPFTGAWLDTTVLADANLTIVPRRALPENSRIYYRATVTDQSGLTVASPVTGPRFTPPWVTLITPPTVVGQPVRTRTPRFVWRSPAVSEPPGPWSYTLVITTPVGSVENFVGSDTTFTPLTDLESNAVYRWSVRAQLPRSGQGTVVDSPFSFVVEDAMVPIATTELYPPFPSPFPGVFRSTACIWFDLKNPSTVELEVTDLRGLHVRRLAPNPEMFGTFAPGRYGRGRTELNEGCDQRLQWDGTDDRGVYVPEGVYVIRFRGDGRQIIRRVVFRGARR